MKKFSFSLQKILDMREFAAEQRKAELGVAVSAANRLRQSLEENIVKREQACASRAGCADIGELRMIDTYVAGLDIKRDDLTVELAAAEEKVEECRAAYAAALKLCKVLINLKEKQYAEYKKECQRAEDLALDEIGSRRTNQPDNSTAT
ncbi:MAG TPA: flagellar export protein FliJ [Candidatus Treponema faecavium]|nr:flagellar export protein FliJ [Candidatus Treponema faecavium]